MYTSALHAAVAVLSVASCALANVTVQAAANSSRLPLSYAPTPNDVYVAPVQNDTVTLLSLIHSRPELSSLAEALREPAGFVEAFDTEPTWNFTFFAPSNTAFENLGTYWQTFAATKKGKWWLGNQLKHHYVPNSQLKTSDFNETLTSVQASTYLWISTRIAEDTLVLNEVASVTEADIPITNVTLTSTLAAYSQSLTEAQGVVHIIDHVLDPSAQVFNVDLPRQEQVFIAGSCSNPDLAYC